MIRFGIILMLVCLIASAVLAFTYKTTSPLITLQKEKEEKETLNSIYEEAEEFRKVEDYYLVYKNKNLLGYILRISIKGYAGPIELLVGFDKEGVINKVYILEQKETPGLGGKIAEIKYQEKEPWFLRQFKGKKTENLSSEINTITGATISSKAVIEGIKKKTEEFLKNHHN
ncbi:MAG: RnfABCDGE type electron transport complex subunit G [Candidatus Omnitrophica bacterium]|nr:RnfABCDGE type electron transport complex subunit G [Candidatus Omnitrophota bacterium]